MSQTAPMRIADIDTQLAQLRESRAITISTAGTTTATSGVKTSWWSVHDAMTISSAVLVFGLVVIAFATRALSRGLKTDQVLRLFGMLTIIIMAVFLIVAGYGNEQIAPALGLLGTVAGYLLARSSAGDAAHTPPTPPAGDKVPARDQNSDLA